MWEFDDVKMEKQRVQMSLNNNIVLPFLNICLQNTLERIYTGMAIRTFAKEDVQCIPINNL